MTITRVLFACLAFLASAAFGFWGIPSLSASHALPSSGLPPAVSATSPPGKQSPEQDAGPPRASLPTPEPAQAPVVTAKLPEEKPTPKAAPLAAAPPLSLKAAPLPGNTIPPQLLLHPEPTLTDAARRANVTEALVKLALNVTTVGFSQNIRVIKGENYGLNRKAIDAVSHWHFRPASRNGELVPAEIEVDVHFLP